MTQVIPIYPSPLNREFRDVMVNLINSAKEKIIFFENPEDGFCYMLVDGKHYMKWVEPGTPITFFHVESRPKLLKDLRTSTLETVYGYNNQAESTDVYAEYERFPDGTYEFRIVKELAIK